jgi:hypothetical protein
MNSKTRKIIGWSLSGLVALMLVASATDKIIGSAHALEMAESFGLSATSYAILGVIEILSVVLFLIPRTGVLGTLLLASYFGGAIATHLQHQQEILFPMAIEAVIWIAGILRFPELIQRFLGNTPLNKQ